MFNSFWGLEFNPFTLHTSEKNYFETADFKQAISRLNHLKDTKGIGLFTGTSGVGKTFALRYFVNTLNPNLFKVVYIPLSTVTVLEFYKSLAAKLGLEVVNKKIDLFNSIQDRMVTLVTKKKIFPVIIVDEAQYLKTDVLNDIKILLNFKMDSQNCSIFVLNGQPVLNSILSKSVHEALFQRIVINYNFQGISGDDVEQYISSRFKLAGCVEPIFDSNALTAIKSCISGSMRKLNLLIEKCMLIAFNEKLRNINTDIVMTAQNDISLI
jgi:type II secretory pathway predicted ATPase ExeA